MTDQRFVTPKGTFMLVGGALSLLAIVAAGSWYIFASAASDGALRELSRVWDEQRALLVALFVMTGILTVIPFVALGMFAWTVRREARSSQN